MDNLVRLDKDSILEKKRNISRINKSDCINNNEELNKKLQRIRTIKSQHKSIKNNYKFEDSI